MSSRANRGLATAVLAGFLVASPASSSAHSQEGQEDRPPVEAGRQATPKAKASPETAVKRGTAAKPETPPKTETAATWHTRRGLYFQRNWGVDIVGVRRVASGLMMRFDYRVVDPERAAVLSDHKARPYLIDEATGTALAIPAMEKIGELRQMAPLEARRTYFMIFGNPGGLVKHGGRVTLVVGNLRAEGLVVD